MIMLDLYDRHAISPADLLKLAEPDVAHPPIVIVTAAGGKLTFRDAKFIDRPPLYIFGPGKAALKVD